MKAQLKFYWCKFMSSFAFARLLQVAKLSRRMRIVPFLNDFFVRAYKLAGFVVLAAVLVGMFSYLSVSACYLLSRSWALPSTLTPASDKVMQAKMALINQEAELGKIRSDIIAQQKLLEHYEYSIAQHKQFQLAFLEATEKRASQARQSIGSTKRMLQQYALLGKDNDESQQSEQILQDQLQRQIITKDEFLRLKSTITNHRYNGLSALERSRQLADRLDELNEAARLEQQHQFPKSIEALLLHKPYLDSKIESSLLQSQMEPIRNNLLGKQQIEAQHEQALRNLKESPIGRASSQPVHVAFVPYGNMHKAQAKMPVRGCYLLFLLCRKVGAVKKVFADESIGKHPVTGREIRGQFIEIEYQEAEWSTLATIILGRPPFLI
jgi:hypothetical protein